jgi:hypothetical protein
LHTHKISPRRNAPGDFYENRQISFCEQEKAFMKPPQAWQAALGQLQLEMPKAAFDTWVRNTEFISFEDDIFTIGIHNAYARDWMADRLTSTIVKLLTGIMNQVVEIRFVVVDSQGEEDIESDGDLTEVEAVFDLPYDEIVGTGIIAIPAYFGRYHLPELGPNLAWMVVGFRQAAYSAGRRSGARNLRISERSIARWSGINRRTFRRRKKKAETWEKLVGFVSLSSTQTTWVAPDGQKPVMAAHAYRLQMTMPLTAAHACSLRQWLMGHLEQAGGPEAVLQLAINTRFEELLLADVELVEAVPITVLRLVLELFDGQLVEAQLKSLAQRLHHHIMPPNDQIIITHFFVENLLPLMGPGPGWLLTLLRDRCYLNRETGEYRNQVTVQGGWAEIAGWMGLNRPKTVWEWLHGTKPNDAEEDPPKPRNPYLRVFLTEVVRDSERPSSFKSALRIFNVVQEEVPSQLLPEMEKSDQGISNWTEWFTVVIARLSPMESQWRECPLNSGANVPYGMARLSPSVGANVPYAMARLSPSNGANVPYLSSLTPSLNHLSSRDITNLPTRDGEGRKGTQPIGEGHAGRWDWDFLFAFNSEINPKDQDWLQKKADPETFVAWLIYAYSKKGMGIDSQVMFAVRRVQQGRAEPAEVSMYRNYSPVDLHSFLTHYPSGGHWDDMLPQTGEKRAELKRRLCGPNS